MPIYVNEKLEKAQIVTFTSNVRRFARSLVGMSAQVRKVFFVLMFVSR